MKIAFRVDSSTIIGTGHLRRCLNLASLLQEQGYYIYFICRDHSGNINDLIRQKGFGLKELNSTPKVKIDPENSFSWLGVPCEQDAEETVDCLEENTDWVIVDHYEIDEKWERLVRPFIQKIMVVDDLANRKHLCHILLDQNLKENPEQDYKDLVPKTCLTFFGPDYALLNKAFFNKRICPPPQEQVQCLFIFFGGTDRENFTLKTLKTLKNIGFLGKIKVLSTSVNKNIESLKSFRKDFSFDLYLDQEDVASIMLECDAAIGSGGGNLWERIYVGLPSLVFCMAENQKTQIKHLKNRFIESPDSDDIFSGWTNIVKNFLYDEFKRKELSKALYEFMFQSKLGLIQNILYKLINFNGLTPLRMMDLSLLYKERNVHEVRLHMNTQRLISLEDHYKWFNISFYGEKNMVLIFFYKGARVGMVNFYNINSSERSCLWGFYIFKGFSGRGLGYLMCETALKYIRQLFSIKTVYAEVLESNLRSINLHKKLGFNKFQKNKYQINLSKV